MMTLVMAMAMAESTPGRGWIQMSARDASQVRSGSTTMSFVSPCVIMSTIQCPKKPSPLDLMTSFPQTRTTSGYWYSGWSQRSLLNCDASTTGRSPQTQNASDVRGTMQQSPDKKPKPMFGEPKPA